MQMLKKMFGAIWVLLKKTPVDSTPASWDAHNPSPFTLSPWASGSHDICPPASNPSHKFD